MNTTHVRISFSHSLSITEFLTLLFMHSLNVCESLFSCCYEPSLSLTHSSLVFMFLVEPFIVSGIASSSTRSQYSSCMALQVL